MPLAGQVAKLLTRGAQKLMSTEPGAIIKHEPTMRVLTPEQEAASFAPIGTSSHGLLPEEPAPITPVETTITPIETDVVPPVRTEIDELVSPAVPDRPPIRRQVEDLGLSEKEVDELLIPDPIDISKMSEAWKAPYMKARDQGFTVPLYHFTRAGEEIQFDPRGEGTGFLDPLLLKHSANNTMDIGIHLGTLSSMGKQNEKLGKKKRKVMGVTLGQKQEEEQLGQAMLPLVTKLDNVAIIPDMGRFKLPSEWLEELSNLSIELKPNKTIEHILRKDNLEKDFKSNKGNIKNALDSSIETVDDFKKYAKEDGDFVFWPEDGNFVYLKNEKKLSMLAKFVANRFNPLKGMSPTLWKQLMEAAHALHMKNIKLTTKEIDPDAGLFIPEKIHPSLIDDWYIALRKILEENEYDAFAYPNYAEDYGAFSYMFLDPKKVKSIFSKKFDPESISFGKAKGGVVDMRNGGRVRMVEGGKAMEIDPAKPFKDYDKLEAEFVPSFPGESFVDRFTKQFRAMKGRKQAGQELSETEKAVAVTRKGTTEPIKYMYDYGKRREERLSQVPTGHKFYEDRLGHFQPEGKNIYVTPRMDIRDYEKESEKGQEHRWNVPEGSSSLPFVGETQYPERKSTIATEQHEFTHAFLDFLDYAARDKKILSTLSKQDQIKLFKFMDFRQKEEFGPDFEFKGQRIEHELMDQPTDIRTSYFKPGKGTSVGDFLSERKGLGTKPESSFTEDLFSPRQDAPPVEYGMGIGKASTISELAKVFNKASAKNPEIHKRALKKWTKSERFFKRPTAEFDEAIKQLQGTEEEEQLQQEQEQYGQKNGGRVGAAVVAASLMASGGQAMDMRNGGVVGMVHGGPVHDGPVLDYTTPEEDEFNKDYDAVKQMEALLAKRQAAVDYGGLEQPDTRTFSPSEEFIEYLKSVENASKKGYDKKTGLWHPYKATGNVGGNKEEIFYGIVRPKTGRPLTQEEAEKLFMERIQHAAKGAERVVDKYMQPGTFKQLSRRKQEAFVDYVYNMGEGEHTKIKNKKTGKIEEERTGFTAFRKFIPALINNDVETIEKEYIRHSGGVPLGRNKIFRNYFREFFVPVPRFKPTNPRQK